MFSFTSESKDKNGKRPINKQDRKKAKQFSKGVTRFLRYNKDLLPEEKFSEIQGMRQEFVTTAADDSKKRMDLDTLADEISKVCKKAIPDFQPSLLKENIEVLFVAVVIAMGIRAYFIQQFKIPTGSMQPTLNGIIAYPAPEIADESNQYRAPDGYERPNFAKRVIDSVWFGRSHVEWRAKEDGDSFASSSYNSSSRNGFYGKNKFILFPRTYLTTQKGHRYVASGTESRVRDLIHNQNISKSSFTKGDILARGYIETGDMLVVNKMIYHWKKPNRGDVFVFNTRDIPMIQNSINPAYGSQHYIKRLCGLPGDHLQIEPPKLIVNGEPAKEFGIRRVMAAEGLYGGYLQEGRYKEFKLKEKQYVALGDNSGNSLDSRSWGHVPEQNIVGRAMFVFYPFGNHFGAIR